MYLLIFISALINLSEIRANASPYYDDIQAICAVIGVIFLLVGPVRYLSNRIPKSTTLKDAEILVDYKEYFTEKEREKPDVPYISRIESNVERDVIKEATEFLKSSEQVLIIIGESGIGKTRLQLKSPKELMNLRNLQRISNSKESAYF